MTRRRYRWNPETMRMEEVASDYSGADRRAQMATEELTYGGMQATDGTPINTKRRHREYMAKTGTTVASDFTETWKRAEQDRAKFYSGDHDHAGRREDIGRALYESKRRK